MAHVGLVSGAVWSDLDGDGFPELILACEWGPIRVFQQAGVVEANTLATMIFLNRGDHFEGRPLPVEAQLAPAFAVCVGDVDGDGYEDLFEDKFSPVTEYLVLAAASL